MYDVIVIGCGFSGSVVANLFAKKEKKVLLIEKRKHIAGNMYDYRDDNGFLIHKYGPHILMLNNEEVYKYLSQYCSWINVSVNLQTYIDRKYIPLPINLNSVSLLYEKKKANLITERLINTFGMNSIVNVLDLLNNSDNVVRDFGQDMYDKVFVGYNIKMWGLTPEQIDKNVIGRSPIKISYENKKSNSKYEVVPEKGYTHLFHNLLNDKNIEIKLNTDARKLIKIRDQKIFFKDEKFNGIVIYTGPIDELFDYKYGALPYRAIHFRKSIKKVENVFDSIAVTYPMNYKKTRTTEMKKITLEENKNLSVLLSEYPGSYNPISSKYNLPSYPILNKDSKAIFNKYFKEISKIENFYITGRLAEFEYFNMEETILSVFNLFKRIN